jgi:homoserine kinase
MPSSPGDTLFAVVPASSANVGCAFDCAAIAIGLYLRVSATPIQSGSELNYSGANADQVPRDKSNLLVKALERASAASGAPLPTLRLDVQNEIPLGVGLGSSAAAIVGGILLGNELCGSKLSQTEILRLAVEIEGHPDNVAAALLGGFVVAATPKEAANVLVARANVSKDLDFIAVIPDVPLPTEKARAVLPPQYSRRDVVANLQRTALLAARFFSGAELSPELFRDTLHQPYRAPLVPGIAECLAFRHPGLAGVFLSGAGSAVMAIARDSSREIGDALVAEFQRKGTGARALLLKAENRGAQTSIPRTSKKTTSRLNTRKSQSKRKTK